MLVATSQVVLIYLYFLKKTKLQYLYKQYSLYILSPPGGVLLKNLKATLRWNKYRKSRWFMLLILPIVAVSISKFAVKF